MRQGSCAGMLLLGLTVAASFAQASPSIGMRNTFENLSTNGWTSGAANPNPPTAIASGGPLGGTDGYMLLTSNGGSAGGKLMAFPGQDWLGDYTAGPVTGIQLQARNFGPTDLGLRFYFEGSSGISAVTAPVSIAAGSGWKTLFFDLRGSALSGNPDALSDVTAIRFFHAPSATTFIGGPGVVASLGIDNVTAVPEPKAWLMLAAGLAAIGTGTLRQRAHR